MVRLSKLPETAFQKSAVFPDWKGYTDDTLAMNGMLSFFMFHGQGKLYLEIPDALERFTLYVNGKKLDTSAVSGGIWEADLSSLSTDGTNTLQISGIRPFDLSGAVKIHIPYPEVLDADGSLEGIRPEALALISDLIQSDIANGFASAQLAVARNGRLVCEKAWGRTRSCEKDGSPSEGSPAVTTKTLYDLASVTKMFSANYAVQKLVTDGLLDLDSTIVSLLGDGFASKTLDIAYEGADTHPALSRQIAWKRSLTVRDILRHQAGFPASPQYNHPDYDLSRLCIGAPGSNPCYAMNRDSTLEAICRTPLLYEPGTRTVYSDVDYILLTFVIENVTGTRLDRYMRKEFFEPMGLERTTFLPLENGFSPDDCAATELNGNTRDGHIHFPGVRTETVQGEVQDERAWYCMGGVSGHAGLFSCASDLARLASVMLSGGYGSRRYFSRNVMDLFTAPKSAEFGQWGLGWWREGDDQRPWYFGTQSAPSTIGHQGWTGTMVMIDPSRNLVIAYLTNKIHSPVSSPEHSLNAFDGNAYTASSLGFVPQILSVGMDTGRDVTGQLLDLAGDMAASSLRLMKERPHQPGACIRNARSKIQVFTAWAEACRSTGHLETASALAAKLNQAEAALLS